MECLLLEAANYKVSLYLTNGAFVKAIDQKNKKSIGSRIGSDNIGIASQIAHFYSILFMEVISSIPIKIPRGSQIQLQSCVCFYRDLFLQFIVGKRTKSLFSLRGESHGKYSKDISTGKWDEPQTVAGGLRMVFAD